MAIRVTWPSASEEPYEIIADTGTAERDQENVATDGEFGRFSKLAGKLVQVPKAELDEKRNS